MLNSERWCWSYVPDKNDLPKRMDDAGNLCPYHLRTLSGTQEVGEASTTSNDERS